MSTTPDWIERLLGQDWTPEASAAIDRWLAYLESEFPPEKPGKTVLRDLSPRKYQHFRAVCASIRAMPESLQMTALKAVCVANGFPLKTLLPYWERGEV